MEIEMEEEKVTVFNSEDPLLATVASSNCISSPSQVQTATEHSKPEGKNGY